MQCVFTPKEEGRMKLRGKVMENGRGADNEIESVVEAIAIDWGMSNCVKDGRHGGRDKEDGLLSKKVGRNWIREEDRWWKRRSNKKDAMIGRVEVIR